MAQKLKLIELTATPWSDRWQPLTDFVKKAFETSGGLEIETQILETTEAQLKENLKIVLESDANLCRISHELSASALASLPQVTFQASFSGTSGFLIKEKGQWWPRDVSADAFVMTLTSAGNMGQVDLNSYALVAGAGPACRGVIAALAKMGFATVNVADNDGNLAAALVAEMKQRFFKVAFNSIPYQQLTTLPGVHSLVVNTTQLSLDNQLLDELYFFNFLKAGGIVLDLTLVPANTPLISEAEQWGARHLSGDFLEASRDALMIEMATGLKLDVNAYRSELRKKIDAVPFDPSPFLKRFRERGA